MQVTSNELDTIDAQAVFVGNQFIEQMEMALSWGSTEDFYQSNKTEEKVLVNRSFMKSIAVFNTQKDTLRFTLADGTRCRIVGIAEDMNYEPLSKIIKPLVFRHSVENSNFALLTISTTNIKKTINDLDAIWLNIDENTIFEATFLDDEIEKAYYFLTVQIKFFSFLGALAITISCLGLLGMVSYTTENRTKEIAVRKIMGASNQSLYFLLTKNFIKLIAISAAIAIPFSYFFFEKLFLYSLIRYGRGLGIIEVLGSVLFLFMVGFASIYWQTSKVANANPSDNLRYE